MIRSVSGTAQIFLMVIIGKSYELCLSKNVAGIKRLTFSNIQSKYGRVASLFVLSCKFNRGTKNGLCTFHI